MKQAFLLLLIVAFSVTVNGQTSERRWTIGGGTGAYGTIKNGGIGIIPELYFGRYISPRFDIKFQGNLGLYRSTIESDGDFANLFLNLRYKLSDETKNFRPYLYAGPGLIKDDHTKGMNFDAGVGFRYNLTPGISAYFEVGYIHNLENSYNGGGPFDNFWKNTAGFELNLGKSKDSDMDGVSDKKDKCPDTPAGVAVDKDGCPIDTDGDGVPDYKDDCPTVAGLSSLNGCPDADGDGVADSKDKCPNTPKGWKVDAEGCPLDQDKDGVADAIDKCANTPAGVAVDKDGCPIDTDGDGTPDYLDACPTVAGPKENKGCPEEAKSDLPNLENVLFDYDKAFYINGEKIKIDRVVRLLKENPEFKVKVVAHADEKGTDEYNMALSKRRLNSVIKTLNASGITKVRISDASFKGSSEPITSNETEAGRALNRRVEFEFNK